MNGRIYAATGNGDFDANQGGHNYGDSVRLTLRRSLDLLGSYTPTNYQQLEHGDVDLGSTSPALLPPQSSSQTPWMLVQGGKDAILKLLNRAALPGVGNELQLIDLPQGLFSTPAVWTDAVEQAWIFIGFSQRRRSLSPADQRLGQSVSSSSIWQSSAGQQAAKARRRSSPTASSSSRSTARSSRSTRLNGNGALEQRDARAPERRSVRVHWESPIVVNGWVYCSDENGNLTAYSLH